MAVVINEFEVVAEPPARARDGATQEAAAKEGAGDKPLDACDLRAPLGDIHCDTLRVWAH